MKARSKGVNPEFRPKAYFGPQKLEEHLLSNVPGGVVRNLMREMFSAGQDREAQELIDEIGYDGGEVASYLESIHPMFMGGNYLPERQPGEVEIGRINIKSTTYDVTSVYAGRANGKICLRVVDEYDGDTLKKEYLRDKEAGLPIDLPKNYFPGDDDSKSPIVTWRSAANLLFSNWLNYFVYQETPYDIKTIHPIK